MKHSQVIKNQGFTLTELLLVVSLLGLLAIPIYGPAKEFARVWRLTAYSVDAQNLVNVLDLNRGLASDEFFETDVAGFCNKPGGVTCVFTEHQNGSELRLILNTPEGAWSYWGADSTTSGEGDTLKSILTFYPRQNTALVSQYTFFSSLASSSRF